jgi:hypothetical protein
VAGHRTCRGRCLGQAARIQPDTAPLGLAKSVREPHPDADQPADDLAASERHPEAGQTQAVAHRNAHAHAEPQPEPESEPIAVALRGSDAHSVPDAIA